METPEEVLQRMADAEDWFFETPNVDRENSLVILLNPYGNYNNYFCGPSPERNNVAFIQTTHYATRGFDCSSHLIAYEFFASAMRFRAFNVPDYQDRFVHSKTVDALTTFSNLSNTYSLKFKAPMCAMNVTIIFLIKTSTKNF